jgi:hypothetical protein
MRFIARNLFIFTVSGINFYFLAFLKSFGGVRLNYYLLCLICDAVVVIIVN